VAQLALLAATALLLYRIAAGFVGGRPALAATVLYVTYPPFLLYCTILSTETLAAFLCVLLVYLVLRYRRRPAWPLALACGFLGGYAVLVRPSLALFVVPLALAFALSGEAAGWRVRCASVFTLGLGVFACLAPWWVRNARLSGEFVPLTTGGGTGLFTSSKLYLGELSYAMPKPEWDRHNADIFGRIQRYDPGQGGSVVRELAVDRAMGAEGRAKLRALTPALLARGVVLRLWYMWGGTGSWLGGWPHRAVQAESVALILLTLAGCWLCRSQLVGHWPLWLVPLYLTVVHMVYPVETRYSFPGRPFLLIYAGVALCHTISVLQGGVPLVGMRPHRGAERETVKADGDGR
jgi:4-amino-4-deoxy-L-arabinose transferase-like glycosyltransferase